MDMLEVAEIVWKQCLDARPDEKALIVSDPEGERLEIARALLETGKEFTGKPVPLVRPRVPVGKSTSASETVAQPAGSEATKITPPLAEVGEILILSPLRGFWSKRISRFPERPRARQ